MDAGSNRPWKDQARGSSSERWTIDGFELLARRHGELFDLFDHYDQAPTDVAARAVWDALTLHTDIEEQVLYPQLRRFVDDGDDLAVRPEAEHASMRLMVTRGYVWPPDHLPELMADL